MAANARLLDLSGKFLGAHVAHKGIITVLWQALYVFLKLSDFVREKP